MQLRVYSAEARTSKLSGEVEAPRSCESAAARLAILALVGGGELLNAPSCEPVRLVASALRRLGFRVERPSTGRLVVGGHASATGRVSVDAACYPWLAPLLAALAATTSAGLQLVVRSSCSWVLDLDFRDAANTLSTALGLRVWLGSGPALLLASPPARPPLAARVTVERHLSPLAAAAAAAAALGSVRVRAVGAARWGYWLLLDVLSALEHVGCRVRLLEDSTTLSLEVDCRGVESKPTLEASWAPHSLLLVAAWASATGGVVSLRGVTGEPLVPGGWSAVSAPLGCSVEGDGDAVRLECSGGYSASTMWRLDRDSRLAAPLAGSSSDSTLTGLDWSVYDTVRGEALAAALRGVGLAATYSHGELLVEGTPSGGRLDCRLDPWGCVAALAASPRGAGGAELILDSWEVVEDTVAPGAVEVLLALGARLSVH